MAHLLTRIDVKTGAMKDDVPPQAGLEVLRQLLLLFQALVLMTKNTYIATSPVQLCGLKEGRKFLERFLKTMPLLEAHFNVHQQMVVNITKAIQPGTRQLHILRPIAKAWPRA